MTPSTRQQFYVFSPANWSTALDEQHNRINGLKGMKPGDVLIYDFRDITTTAAAASPTAEAEAAVKAMQPSGPAHPLRVVQWNIERGYKLEGIVEELKTIDADVVLSQELDISCQRSGYRNVPLAIARELKACCVFVCEFQELPSTANCRRNADSESGCDFGFHGNAIISKKHSIHSLRAFEHSAGLDWERIGGDRKEPRLGTRFVLTGCIDGCDDKPFVSGGVTNAANACATKSSHFVRLQLYTLHLEIFCGPLMRLKQLSDAMQDAKLSRRHFYSSASAGAVGTDDSPFYGDGAVTGGANVTDLTAFAVDTSSSSYTRTESIPGAIPPSQRHFSIVIGGDLNTIMHGIVRLSGLYSDDRMKWLSLGETEAEWLQRKVLSVPVSSKRGKNSPITKTASVGANSSSFRSPNTRAERNLALDTSSQSWSSWLRGMYWRYCYGMHLEHSTRLCNEELKLFDVFDKLHDITLDNPAYKGYVTGKLDWLLLSNLRVTAKSVGNHDYSLSDHKYLVNELALPPFYKNKGSGRVVGITARDACSPAGASNGSVGNGSFFWADDSLSAAYESHPDKRSPVTATIRALYVGVAIAAAVYIPYKCASKFLL